MRERKREKRKGRERQSKDIRDCSVKLKWRKPERRIYRCFEYLGNTIEQQYLTERNAYRKRKKEEKKERERKS